MAILEFCAEGRRVGAVGGVATVGPGTTGKAGPGGDVKTSRLMVSCVVLPRPIEFRYLHFRYWMA